MIDLELERKAFNDWHFLTYGEFVNWWDDAPASWIHNDRWKGWISSAELKQAEIDSLKAQLAKVESGEFVIVPKEPTEAMIKHAYGTYEGATILPYSFYKAMIEAAQGEQNEY